MINSYFRDYTSLHTGNGGEKGYKDITLSYAYYDKDYFIYPDTITTINTPNNLYPYEQININDTTFIKDGAFGSNVPYISDKIYKEINSTSAECNQQYLVTWLSATNNDGYGVWVDRYYYPDIISRIEALSTGYNSLCSDGSFVPSFNSNTQQLFLSTSQSRNFINKNPIFDKISDLVIKPNSIFYYDRVGPVAVSTFISSFNDKLLSYNFNGYYNASQNTLIQSDTVTSTSLNGNKYYKYSVDNINKTGSFVLKFDISRDWLNDRFHSLFGSKLTDGFSITQFESITPFTFIHASSTLNVYNSNQTLIYTLTFPDPIIDVIVGDHLGDYHITTVKEGSYGTLYKVSPFGQIKASVNIQNLSGSYVCYDNTSDEVMFLISSEEGSVKVNLNTLSASSLITDIVEFTPNQPIELGLKAAGVKYIPGLYNIDVSNSEPVPGWRLFYGNNVKILNDRYVFHLYNNKSLYREDILDSGKKKSNSYFTTISGAYCSSESTIYDYAIDPDGNVYVLHGENLLTVIDNNRNIKYTKNILNTNTPFVIDFISEFTPTGYKFYPIIVYTNPNSKTVFITPLDSDLQAQNTINTGLTASFINSTVYNNLTAPSRIKHLTNYNYNQLLYSKNTLNFNLVLQNYYNTTDVYKTNISIPLSSIAGNTQTFIVSLNQSSGRFDVYMNGILYESKYFDNYKYKFNLPFTNDFIFGCTAFYNNQTLAQYLGQTSYYFVNRTQIDNFKLYFDELNSYQIQALALEDQPIDNLSITLPCAQRNNIEEISRTFKFTQPYNKSEAVNIVIKNTGITDTATRDSIKNNILLNSTDILPAEVNINDITFKDFNK